MNFSKVWENLEQQWSERGGLTEGDFWFIAEGRLKALWVEQPAPGELVESTVP